MEVNLSNRICGRRSVIISDIISMLEDFDIEIQNLEEKNEINEELLEGNDITIAEKNERIAYLEDLLRQNDIDY